MRKLIAITLLLLLTAPCLRAQRKEISQARVYIKSGKDKDLEKAERLMTDLLSKDSINRKNTKIYATWYEVVKKQYEVGNEKLYLKEKYDTTQLFNLAKRLFTIAETLDSIDSQPDKKGRIKPEYRKKHAEELMRLRTNLYSGGAFNMRKTDYHAAHIYFDMYIDSERQPLFSAIAKNFDRKMLVQAAYWATYCGYKNNNSYQTLKHAKLALADTSKTSFVYEYMAEAYLKEKNEEKFVETLLQGFSNNPTFPYFFPHLMDYYNSHQQYDRALALADTALLVAPDNDLFAFAKSSVLLNTGKYDESLTLSIKLIERQPMLSEAYYNAGTAILNKILNIENSTDARLHKKKVKDLYQQARTFIEEYRRQVANNSHKWAPLLYKIYLNLNMGKQFEEIDAIMKKQ